MNNKFCTVLNKCFLFLDKKAYNTTHDQTTWKKKFYIRRNIIAPVEWRGDWRNEKINLLLRVKLKLILHVHSEITEISQPSSTIDSLRGNCDNTLR